jgi:adenine-specific DNA-methyltransferase
MRDTANKSKEQAPGEDASKPALLRPARAELVWEGKYDGDGRRVAPLRVALPFQTIETVNESAQERQRGFRFGSGFRKEAWRNRLIWGDKKYVLPSLLLEFAGKVNLIYIDPPFDTGADFSFTATVPNDPDTAGRDPFTFIKEPSIIEHKAYRDTWGRGIESYLQWFYESVLLLHELLHENGSIYVHLDWHVAHHGKIILDEIFGKENFRNDYLEAKRRKGLPRPLLN